MRLQKMRWLQTTSLQIALSVSLLTIILLNPVSPPAGQFVKQSPHMKGERKMVYPNYEKCSDSPSFDENELGIKVNFTSGKMRNMFSTEEPWVVFGTYQVGDDVIEDFGGEIDPNVLIVVSHRETRGVYIGGILKDELPERTTEKSPATGGKLISVKSYFNIDLKKQCRIQASPGKYWVIVLLGRLVSSVLEFEVK